MYRALQGASIVREYGITHDEYRVYVADTSRDRPAPPQALNDFLRGSVWNDDPVSLLFNDGYLWSKGTGTDYALTILNSCADGDQKFKATVKWPFSLMCHSHYGSLQFLHSMASLPDERFDQTRLKILAFANWLYLIAIGEITDGDNLKLSIERHLNTEYADLLGGAFREALLPSDMTVKGIFFMNDNGTPEAAQVEGKSRSLKQVAIGSLIHMMADSFAVGHTGRETAFHSLGPTMQFRDYTTQGRISKTKQLHSDQDVFPWQNVAMKGKPAGNRYEDGRNLGFHNSIDYATRLLLFWKAKAAWFEGPQSILEGIFQKSDHATNRAGSGQILYKFHNAEKLYTNCQLCFYPVKANASSRVGPSCSLDKSDIVLTKPQCTTVSEDCQEL